MTEGVVGDTMHVRKFEVGHWTARGGILSERNGLGSQILCGMGTGEVCRLMFPFLMRHLLYVSGNRCNQGVCVKYIKDHDINSWMRMAEEA